MKYRALYEIYPSKACINETDEQCHSCMRNRILRIGRIPGRGRGDSANHADVPILKAEGNDVDARSEGDNGSPRGKKGKELNLVD